MGEAKRRGTRQQRIAEAKAKQEIAMAEAEQWRRQQPRVLQSSGFTSLMARHLAAIVATRPGKLR